MGFSRYWLTMSDKEIKVHLRVIRMIFPMIQRAKNDRSVRRALPVYDMDAYDQERNVLLGETSSKGNGFGGETTRMMAICFAD